MAAIHGPRLSRRNKPGVPAGGKDLRVPAIGIIQFDSIWICEGDLFFFWKPPNGICASCGFVCMEIAACTCRRTANSLTALVGPCVPLALIVLCVVPEVVSHGTGDILSVANVAVGM